jgi:hypothetical protein
LGVVRKLLVDTAAAAATATAAARAFAAAAALRGHGSKRTTSFVSYAFSSPQNHPLIYLRMFTTPRCPRTAASRAWH